MSVTSLRVWRLALPNILANLTIPLLGAVDTAVIGHLGAAEIGAVAIGSTVFSFLYWGFGFLRMGTTGVVAQAHGAGHHRAKRDGERGSHELSWHAYLGSTGGTAQHGRPRLADRASAHGHGTLAAAVDQRQQHYARYGPCPRPGDERGRRGAGNCDRAMARGPGLASP
ncbi:MAG TPA: MATE family efflux transporter [Alphaproteobacteria bacterium]|nr:MATE family efflux transporter [Alphaproteobacteria bacterium]